MEYTSYWTILETPSYEIKANFIFLIVCIVGFLVWNYEKYFSIESSVENKVIKIWGGGFFAIFGLIFYVLLTFYYPDNSAKLMEATLKSGIYPTVEGEISDFKRPTYSSRSGSYEIESFRIDSLHFKYANALLSKFNSFSECYNHVIVNGKKVRITYRVMGLEDKKYCEMLKLEIQK